MKFRERIAARVRAVDTSLTNGARSEISFCFKDYQDPRPGLRGSRSLGITVDDTLIPDACRYPVNGGPLAAGNEKTTLRNVGKGWPGNEDRAGK